MARRKNKAVFLDRDGTVIREAHLLRSVARMRLLPSAADAIRAFGRMGFLVIVVTNQPVVARGWATEAEVDTIHGTLMRRLGKLGAKIDAIYYCPHHPGANLKRYRIRCRCRKPNIGLIMKAAHRHTIDLKRSLMIGDRTADIAAGKRAGIRTILVRTGYAGRDGQHKTTPDFTARNLGAAVQIIKKYAT